MMNRYVILRHQEKIFPKKSNFSKGHSPSSNYFLSPIQTGIQIIADSLSEYHACTRIGDVRPRPKNQAGRIAL